jgi:hypothetical protein
MKKSTEKNRLKRMARDARLLFINGLITSSGLDSINKQISAAMKKI